MLMPDDSVVREAIEAMRRYHQAEEARESVVEVELRRFVTEQQFQSISDYQLAALEHQPLTQH